MSIRELIRAKLLENGKKKKLIERSLYHGTTADKEEDIRRYGLLPTIGSFVQDAYDLHIPTEAEKEKCEEDCWDELESVYGDEASKAVAHLGRDKASRHVTNCLGNCEGQDPEDLGYEELSFSAQKNDLHKAINAMIHHVGKKAGKYFHDVTVHDIRVHGMLIKFEEGDLAWEHRPHEESGGYDEHSQQVEPGDWYSSNVQHGDLFLTGNKLVRFLRQKTGGVRGSYAKWLFDRS